MTDKHIFQATNREITGKKVSQLRKQGIGVGSISTPSGKSISIQFQQRDLEKLLNTSGESTLIYIKVEGESKDRPTLLEEVQYGPLTQELYHVAFRQVSLKEKVSAAIPVEIVGEIDISDATLVVTMQEVEVEALPTDLPEKFEVDVTTLTEVGQSITLADLKFDTTKVALVLGEDQDAATSPVVMVQGIKEEVEESSAGTADGAAPEGAVAEQPKTEATSEPAA
jgi:large subunit ribosomal protein L25